MTGDGTPTDAAAGAAPQQPRRMRASDADRAVVIDRLQDALGRGLLTFDEAGERITAAHAVRFVDELPLLTSDLPVPPPVAAPAVGWRRIGESVVAQVRYDLQPTSAAGGRSRRFVLTVAGLLLLALFFIAMVAAATHGVGGPEHFHGPGGFGPGGR